MFPRLDEHGQQDKMTDTGKGSKVFLRLLDINVWETDADYRPSLNSAKDSKHRLKIAARDEHVLMLNFALKIFGKRIWSRVTMWSGEWLWV